MTSGGGVELARACLDTLTDLPDEAPPEDVVAALGELLRASAGAGALQVCRTPVDGPVEVIGTFGGPAGAPSGRTSEGRCGDLVVVAEGVGIEASELSLLAGILDLELRRRAGAVELTDRLRELETQRRDGTAARSELSETTARLSSLVGTNALAIVALDADGQVVLWNQGAEDLLGWSADEMLGSPLRELMPTDLCGLDLDEMRRTVREARSVRSFELRLRHRDGTYRELEGSLSPILDDRGAVTGSSVIYRDVGERNAALRRLADNEELFRLLADSSQDVVYRMGFAPSPVVEYISPAAVDQLGFTPAQLVADPGLIGTRVHPEDRHLLLDVSSLVDAPDQVRVRFQRADGRWRWFEDRRNPLVDERGGLVGVSGVLRDVTAEVESEQRLRRALEHERAAAAQLRRSDEVKSRFLSALSHELRTPLTSILGFAETAERSLAADPEPPALAFVRRIRVNARRLEVLIGDLLDVERLTRGPGEVHRERCDLTSLLRATAGRVDLGARELELEVPERCEADVDVTLLTRAVENLLRNAGRHTPLGTHVVLRLEPSEARVVITVEDDGPGVPESARARVVAPFEQGERAAADARPGTGIGLTLVDRYVRAQGGDLHVGERPGGGARFTLVLPRRAGPSPDR